MRVEDLKTAGAQYTIPNLGTAKLVLLSQKQEKKPLFLGFGKIFDARSKRQVWRKKYRAY